MKPPKLNSGLQAWRGFGISFGYLAFLIQLFEGGGVADLGHRPTYLPGGGGIIKSSN